LGTHDLAWAAGFFDGEGWANRKERGVQSRINQADPDGVPDVLRKFRRIVGVGRIKGPLIMEGKQPLYYWEATSRPDIARVAELIGPWLCPVKRAEFKRTLGAALPPVVWPGSMSEELAWAGGFFDGEGSTYWRNIGRIPATSIQCFTSRSRQNRALPPNSFDSIPLSASLAGSLASVGTAKIKPLTAAGALSHRVRCRQPYTFSGRSLAT